MTTHQELKLYHDELIEKLRGTANWIEKDPIEDAVENLREITDEIESAFHALRAQLPNAAEGSEKK